MLRNRSENERKRLAGRNALRMKVRARLQLESLEERRLLAGDVMVTVVDGLPDAGAQGGNYLAHTPGGNTPALYAETETSQIPRFEKVGENSGLANQFPQRLLNNAGFGEAAAEVIDGSDDSYIAMAKVSEGRVPELATLSVDHSFPAGSGSPPLTLSYTEANPPSLGAFTETRDGQRDGFNRYGYYEIISNDSQGLPLIYRINNTPGYTPVGAYDPFGLNMFYSEMGIPDRGFDASDYDFERSFASTDVMEDILVDAGISYGAGLDHPLQFFNAPDPTSAPLAAGSTPFSATGQVDVGWTVATYTISGTLDVTESTVGGITTYVEDVDVASFVVTASFAGVEAHTGVYDGYEIFFPTGPQPYTGMSRPEVDWDDLTTYGSDSFVYQRDLVQSGVYEFDFSVSYDTTAITEFQYSHEFADGFSDVYFETVEYVTEANTGSQQLFGFGASSSDRSYWVGEQGVVTAAVDDYGSGYPGAPSGPPTTYYFDSVPAGTGEDLSFTAAYNSDQSGLYEADLAHAGNPGLTGGLEETHVQLENLAHDYLRQMAELDGSYVFYLTEPVEYDMNGDPIPIEPHPEDYIRDVYGQHEHNIYSGSSAGAATLGDATNPHLEAYWDSTYGVLDPSLTLSLAQEETWSESLVLDEWTSDRIRTQLHGDGATTVTYNTDLLRTGSYDNESDHDLDIVWSSVDDAVNFEIKTYNDTHSRRTDETQGVTDKWGPNAGHRVYLDAAHEVRYATHTPAGFGAEPVTTGYEVMQGVGYSDTNIYMTGDYLLDESHDDLYRTSTRDQFDQWQEWKKDYFDFDYEYRVDYSGADTVYSVDEHGQGDGYWYRDYDSEYEYVGQSGPSAGHSWNSSVTQFVRGGAEWPRPANPMSAYGVGTTVGALQADPLYQYGAVGPANAFNHADANRGDDWDYWYIADFSETATGDSNAANDFGSGNITARSGDVVTRGADLLLDDMGTSDPSDDVYLELLPEVADDAYSNTGVVDQWSLDFLANDAVNGAWSRTYDHAAFWENHNYLPAGFQINSQSRADFANAGISFSETETGTIGPVAMPGQAPSAGLIDGFFDTFGLLKHNGNTVTKTDIQQISQENIYEHWDLYANTDVLSIIDSGKLIHTVEETLSERLESTEVSTTAQHALFIDGQANHYSPLVYKADLDQTLTTFGYGGETESASATYDYSYYTEFFPVLRHVGRERIRAHSFEVVGIHRRNFADDSLVNFTPTPDDDYGGGGYGGSGGSGSSGGDDGGWDDGGWDDGGSDDGYGGYGGY